MNNFSINKRGEIVEKIHKIFHSKNDVDFKLSGVAQVIADGFSADACACYVAIDDTSLELFSSYGFANNAAHRVSMRFGEGVVGDVAKFRRPISVADAWQYPNFSYKSEIGEDNLRSFLGVPIMRWNKTIGVLTLQRKTDAEFSSSEVESLETISMVVSRFLSSDEVDEFKKNLGEERGEVIKEKVKGFVLNKGYGIGSAVVHKRINYVTEIFAENKEEEQERLKEAFDKMNKDIDDKFSNHQVGGGEYSDILNTYAMFAKDKGWYKKIEGNILAGMTAEAAVERAYEDMWNRMSMSNDTYLKERLLDLRDIADRLQQYLNKSFAPVEETKDKDIIVVAKSMGPAELMDYDYQKIRGLIIEDGTPTMHVSIVAKALGIPVISKIRGMFNDIRDGQIIAIDGDDGDVYINPSSLIIDKIESKVLYIKKQAENLEQIKDLPCKSLDDVNFNMYINVGLAFDLDYLKSTNCDGVGLYRTEIPFMSSHTMPDVDRQIYFYKELMDAAGEKKVIFRSLDVGSDKLLPYWSGVVEENPAIGWRSIRITLDRRAILRQQLRAFLRASKDKELNIMFPMISNLEEFNEAKETLLIEIDKENKKGNGVPRKVNIGLMIEVPSVIYQLDEILKVADFISIGTNDLSQFIFACDRGNTRLNNRYDVLSVPFLRVMKEIVSKANDANVLCSVCGEMASNPIEALALVGLGYRNLSSSGSSFARVKSMIRSTSIEEIEDYMNTILESSGENIRAGLMSYAYDHAIEIY